MNPFMKKNRRETPEASISFLDVISCGFGAIVLLLIIARIGDPIAFEQAEQYLQKSVKELQQQLFNIRDNTATVNDQMLSRTEELNQLERRIALLREKLASVEKQLASKTSAESSEAADLQLALQILTEEMERLLGPDFQKTDQIVGGIPVDSEYIIFVIDSSGSMQSAAWAKVQKEMLHILDVYPEVIGIQVMNDMGNYMFPSFQNRWIPDTPEMRKKIRQRLPTWQPFSNSSPVEGIQNAIHSFYRKDRKISIYVLGDDFSGRSVRPVIQAVRQINKENPQEQRVRIHAIGFPVHLLMVGQAKQSAVKFANLMRELSYQNGGTFIGLTSLE